jgi:hypothetical protein
MSRLTIDITDQQRDRLTALAALQGKTVGEYAIERLFSAGAGEPEQAWQELRAILSQRIARGLAGEVSKQTVAAIVEEELNAAGQA